MTESIQLYEHPLSPYAQKIRILLREKGLAFDMLTPAAIGSGSDNPALAQLNPRLEVPALVHEGATLFDSTIILEYLEERFPAPQMMPSGPAARARMRMIEEVCDTHWEAINWGLGEVRFFGRGGDTLGPALRAAAVSQLADLHVWLERQLGDGPWLTGAAFGWGDLCAVPYVAMSDMFGIAPPAGSALAAWYARVMGRPAVATTVGEARATLPAMDAVRKRIASGAFKREFRDHRLEWMIRSGGLQVVIDGLANQDIRFTDIARFAAQQPGHQT